MKKIVWNGVSKKYILLAYFIKDDYYNFKRLLFEFC